MFLKATVSSSSITGTRIYAKWYTADTCGQSSVVSGTAQASADANQWDSGKTIFEASRLPTSWRLQSV